jgi:pyruvate/2-oxoglutarate dehydrogenase complex dihydrolipoamide dehydrogenase (E3) component
VTVIEHGPQLMTREDPDAADEVQRILGEEGIGFLLGAQPLKVQGRSGEEVSLTVCTASGEQQIEGSDILSATGRIPNTAGIGLDEAGVELDERGYIRVNERLETTAPGVWAIGECAGSPQFTRVSIDDFRIIRDNLAGGNRSTRDRLVPYFMFTELPLARVGLSESEAERQGVAVRVARLAMTGVRRTATTDETQGFMKVLVDGSDDRILGFTMIGAEAGEVMAAVQTAMLADLPYPRLRDAILAHPTMAEGLDALFLQCAVPVRANSRPQSRNHHDRQPRRQSRRPYRRQLTRKGRHPSAMPCGAPSRCSMPMRPPPCGGRTRT